MYKNCYELKIEIPVGFGDRINEIHAERESKAIKYLAPDVHRDEYPELWNILGSLADWMSPKARILKSDPTEFGSSKIHLDINEHGQYEDLLISDKLPEKIGNQFRMNQNVITQTAINIPLFEPVGVKTKWYRQVNPDNIHPYDFWLGKEYEMEVIDEFEITNKPVLFNTGVWHAPEDSPKERCMLSFCGMYTLNWDTLVNVAQRDGLLIER